jgi:hypothetical protein
MGRTEKLTGKKALFPLSCYRPTSSVLLFAILKLSEAFFMRETPSRVFSWSGKVK